ncbi:MAG: GNAT family N-acetyltransferase [Sphingomonadales bacterium]|jgi:N-acetylglutamate synthase-like GNAT family acetyltransferase
MLELRPATNADLEAVAELVLSIQVGEFNVPITREDQPDLQDLESVFNVGNGVFLIALHEERLVGTIGLVDAGQGLGVLRKMFVASDYRGREWGTAKLLLDALMEHARDNGFNTVQLGTQQRLAAACRFYAKHGFKEIAKENLPDNFPLMAVDDTFFTKACC